MLTFVYGPALSTLSTTRLLAFARELQRATTFPQLLEAIRVEVQAAIGYEHAWLFVADRDDATEVRLIDIAGSKSDQVWEDIPVLRIEGDAMLEEIMRGDAPVVVADARTDPRTDKAIVDRLGNRTIVNVPLRLLDKPFGAFGTGTFGDEEGIRPPTSAQLDYLVGMAGQLAVAAGRIRFLEERRAADAAILERERTIRSQAEAIRELSIPVLQLRRGALLVPLVGALDAERTSLLTERLLADVRAQRARVVIIDITGVPTVDAQVAADLLQTAVACRLMGAATIVSGLSAGVAHAIAATGIDLDGLATVSDLASAIEQVDQLHPRTSITPT